MPISECVFESEDIVLQDQGCDEEQVSVNICECMKCLTELADPEDLLKDPLFEKEGTVV